MNLNKIAKIIRERILIILGAIILIFLIIELWGFLGKPQNIDTTKIFSSIGPISGKVNTNKYLEYKEGIYVFYFNINNINGDITYYKYNTQTNSYYEYFMKSPSLYKGKSFNNPIYLSYYLSYYIFNAPTGNTPQELINYNNYLKSYYLSMPKFLNNGKIISSILGDIQNFYATTPLLEGIYIQKYIPGKEYIFKYKYLLTLKSGQAGDIPQTSNVIVKVENIQGIWQNMGIKL